MLGGCGRYFGGYSQLISLWPGRMGDRLRYGFYKLTLASVGWGTRICFGTVLCDQQTRIGDRVYIGLSCNIGRCEIGQDTLLGSGVHIVSGFNQHGFDDLEKSIWEQPGQKQKVHIGSDCWIGNQSLIGSDVGDKCVIGAASVVVTPIPEASVAVGNPARVVRQRGQA